MISSGSGSGPFDIGVSENKQALNQNKVINHFKVILRLFYNIVCSPLVNSINGHFDAPISVNPSSLKLIPSEMVKIRSLFEIHQKISIKPVISKKV